MTVRRSAGVEAVKGSVRSAWYAELNFISAFGVEVALAAEAECIGVKGRKCENGLQFRIRRRGVSSGYSLPACVSTAPSGNRNGGGNAAGHTRIAWQFGPSVLSCISVFDRKKRLKKVIRITFLPFGMPAVRDEKGGHEAAFEMSVSRQGKRQTVPSAVPAEAEAVVERLTVSPSRCQSEWRMMKSFTSASLTPAARASRDTVIGSPLPNMYSEP